jgi:hypothetical protein
LALIRFDSQVKFYRRREREKAELRKHYDEVNEFYAEQLRRYCAARPNWRTTTKSDFWEIYPNW